MLRNPCSPTSTAPSGFRAWVKIGGVPTPVYEPKQGDRKATCYIESQEGKEL